jgi:lipopolysaccharide transport system permease protein
MLRAIWQYRHFILTAIKGEFRARFARSRLGLLWSILHPMAQAIIFALILSEVLGARLSGVDLPGAYSIYLLSGIAAWSLFSEILTRSMSVFLEYKEAMKKIAFPRICLPVIVWGVALINHLLLLIAIAVVIAFFGVYPNVYWLAIPLGILLISMFAFGLGLILGILNVFSRDVGQVLSVVLQIWFWLTPIVYTRDIIPEKLDRLVDFNPMSPQVELYQGAVLFDRWPDLSSLALPALLAIALCLVSLFIFRRAHADLVDAL